MKFAVPDSAPQDMREIVHPWDVPRIARRVRYLPTDDRPRQERERRKTGELANSSKKWIAWTSAALVASLVHVLADFHIGLYSETSSRMSSLQAANLFFANQRIRPKTGNHLQRTLPRNRALAPGRRDRTAYSAYLHADPGGSFTLRKEPSSVGAYLGLVPARDHSGDSDPQKHITKEGEEMLSVSFWWAALTTS
jgi:Transposase IS116/IS110/IS902 family